MYLGFSGTCSGVAMAVDVSPETVNAQLGWCRVGRYSEERYQGGAMQHNEYIRDGRDVR